MCIVKLIKNIYWLCILKFYKLRDLIITCCQECYAAELWFLLLQKRIVLSLYPAGDSLSIGDDNSFHIFVILQLKQK